jgi:hypothetical protein
MTNTASSGSDSRLVTGLFRDSESVERAYQSVVQRGYDMGDVNVVMSDDTRRRYFSDGREVKTELGRKSAEGSELGGPTEIGVAIVIPILAAIGAAVVIPGLGLVMAGPIAVALAGAGAAGLAAGLIGALSDWGVSEERVRQYEASINDGGILIAVKARSDEDARLIEQQWIALGGEHVYS